jgi:hypothetical protein
MLAGMRHRTAGLDVVIRVITIVHDLQDRLAASW